MVPYHAGKADGFEAGWDAARAAVAAAVEQLHEVARAVVTEREARTASEAASIIHELAWRRLCGDGRTQAIDLYRAGLPAGVSVNNSTAGILGQPPGYATAS